MYRSLSIWAQLERSNSPRFESIITYKALYRHVLCFSSHGAPYWANVMLVEYNFVGNIWDAARCVSRILWVGNSLAIYPDNAFVKTL